MYPKHSRLFKQNHPAHDIDAEYEKQQLLLLRGRLGSPSSFTTRESDDIEVISILDNEYALKECYRLLKRQRVLGVIMVLLLIVVVAQLGRLITLGWRVMPNRGESWGSKISVAEDEKMPKLFEAPEFPLHHAEFNPDERYIGASEEVEESWGRLWPVGRGFVKAHGRDQESSDDSYYGVAAFHQIHCLWMFHKTLYLGVRNETLTQKHLDHSTHCIEYLRQSILCNADPSLEFTYDMKVPGQEDARATFGWNVTHVCRDYQQLLNWAGKHADLNVL